ncbi:thiol:disulfide interchange protein DsbA/DsbL [Campylobacter insulaenigrae]|uniref:Protein disulfide oxidoreductase n=2 Tax=Campylobacter insulaenigrae TaxID=260714 RepID=A0A0A8GZZ1_9BACT|nr:thiol:disulfide interchange protein DsbA/DsbL [Campylobacter insulaenigrae]AJC87468.1 protein disulfide oxidoreductase [Campylobacter insulaenigrae NCTC 12927]MCR6570827.1 thiol:disulfide interchange protein DsbA/DsbL [Campylobacter insulaenigrae]MCR6572515.1 thiol:disulfide interchange protein DsbA/DsbL [Campylobacter insulaenigrae]MCR6575314.1 thiol:disulfide interchange protein DsbA/DsbL [Campylobacter insulaenigrae]MCR6576886.1 thiol:disulfide interchange protein DsbA/DsbL [Campylobacte
MKISKFCLKLVAAMTLVFSINANALSEGKEYIVLKNPVQNAQNSLIEVFSYRCIHCYNHHKFNTLAKVKEALPNLKYDLFSVSAMSENGKALNEMFALASFKEKANGLDGGSKDSLTHKLADVYFVSHFENKMQLSDEELFYKIGLNAIGASKNELKQFLDTKEAKEFLNNYKLANEIAKTYGTPAFVVNGKYQINPEYVTSLEELIRIVKELSSK